MAVTEDCNCRIPSGHVKAQRVAGGSAGGSWGSVVEGGWAIVPRKLAEEYPDYWAVQEQEQPAGAPEQPDTAPDSLEALTVPQLTELAAQRGVQLPRKARKADIVVALQDA